MSRKSNYDPYQRQPDYYLEPPKRLKGMLRYWGPGLILTASVVGSGELIATTGLGAKVGYTALWIILLSCVIKVALQVVIARYAIFSGETTLAFMDKIPGPRWRASWFTWACFFMLLMINFPQGAMLGGVAMVLNIVIPQLSVTTWAVIMAVVTALLLLVGRYGMIERLSTLLVAGFSMATIVCVFLILQTPYRFSAQDIVSGLKFHLPPDGTALAVAIFGITGIGTSELIFYPYWCIEKGYARAVGVRDDSPAWYARAKGWVRTMHWDAMLSMIIFTVLTVAFYTLGAAVLHRQNLVPEGMAMIEILSQMYTEIFGIGAYYLFLLCAFFALFSTIFVSVAANARLFTDCFGLMGFARIENYDDRVRWSRRLVLLMPLTHLILFLSVKLPLWMVIVGGIAQTIILPTIAFGALYLRYKKLDKRLQPSWFLDVILWLSCIVITVVTFYGLATQVIN